MWDISKLQWTREPGKYSIQPDRIEITTMPHTDLWQRTYYHFRNDNAPVLQMETEEKFFSFIVKTDFTESGHRFDQCGIVMYLDSENWLKGSVEYENEQFQHLGSVVTNHGYSDWATTAIPADVKIMWYRFSRRGASAGARMTIASNALRTESILRRCVSAICGKAPARSASESMPAARKIPVLKRYLPIWRLQSAPGRHTTDSSRIDYYSESPLLMSAH